MNILMRLCCTTVLVSTFFGCSPVEPEQAPTDTSVLVETPSYHSPSSNSQSLDQLAIDYADTPFSVMYFSEQTYDRGPALAVAFSVPIDPTTPFHQFIQLYDKDNQPVSGSWILGDQLNIAYFPFIDADTSYSVEVSKGLTAVTGRQLGNDFSDTVTTDSSTQSVRFKSRGAQLSPQLSDGLTVEAINVSEVDIDFHYVDESNLEAFLNSYIGNSYYELQNISRFSELVFSGRYSLNRADNRRRDSLINIKHIEPLQKPGVYIAVMKKAGDYPYDYQVTWFTISDIGMQVRKTANGLLAFVNGVDTAAPIEGVDIRLIDSQGNTLAQQASTENGMAEFSRGAKDAVAAIAVKDNHLSLLKLRTAAMDLTEFDVNGRGHKPLEMFLYGPRDLYRPGETIVVNGILRDYDGRKVDAQTTNVRILRPDGRVHASFAWQGDTDSFYTHTFSLPRNTLTGEWSYEVTLGNSDRFNYSLNIEDFLPERMKLALSTDNSAVLASETPLLSIQGDYLYGAPAAGNRAEVALSIRQARTVSSEYKDFVFGVAGYTDYNDDISLAPITLNQEGYQQLAVPNTWQQAEYPLRVSARTSLFESGGRPVTRSRDFVIWPDAELIGIKPLWEDHIASPESNLSFEFININRQNVLKEKSNVTVTLIREDNNSYWQWNNGWSYQDDIEEHPVLTKVVTFNKENPLQLDFAVEYGNYRLEVSDKNQSLLASYRFFAGWRWDRSADGIMGRPDMVTLEWDKAAYSANDNAALTLSAPYDGTAIVTVEADGLLWHNTADVVNNTATVNIPIDASWRRHDIYATANVIRAGEIQTKHLPKRAFGLMHLPLDREPRRLTIELDAPERMLPDTELVTKIKVKGAEQQQVNITLAAIDTGVLSINNTPTPKPFDWFFAKRRYTTEIRDTWGLLIEQLSSNNARMRFGGDSDAELTRGGDMPVSDVQVVSLFSGKVSLNDNGEGEITLPVPYFNGELQLRALAFSDDAYGHHSEAVKVAAPIVSSVSMPRFLGYGDQSTSTVELRNMTEENMDLKVTLTADTQLGGEQIDQTITLDAGQKTVVQLPISGGIPFGQGTVTLDVVSESNPEEASLHRSWTLGMRSPYAAEWRTFDALIDENTPWELPVDFNAGLATSAQHLLVNVSSNLPINTAEHLSNLLQYPYGCLEQTTSRAWPLITSDINALKPYIDDANQAIIDNRQEAVNSAIARIASLQRSDGSFGLWSSGSNENHWLTVFATDFLLQANDLGYRVNQSTLVSAMERLNRYVRTNRQLWTERSVYSNWPEHYHLSYRAYAAYVLATKQQVRLSDLRQLFDKQWNAAKSPLPLAYLAMALELAGDTQRAKSAWGKALNFGERERGYAGDYGSEIRDLAMTVSLATQSKLADLPSALIVRLQDELRSRRWLSTQERFALFTLSNAFASKPGETWSIEVTQVSANASSTSSHSAHSQWRKLLSGNDIPDNLEVTTDNTSALFINATVQGYPEEMPAPVSDGIRIHRSYFTEQGSKANLQEVTSGDLILVKLDVRSTSERWIPEAMIVEMLPAGFELENQNLESAVKMADMRVDGYSIDQWMGNTDIQYDEYRDDRYVVALPIERDMTTLFYLVRAVTPGHYVVPPSQAEDMYRPYIRAIGESSGPLVISGK